VIRAVEAVAHFAQPDDARHVLQFAVAVGGAGQAVERMVGDVQLHHVAAQLLQPVRLRAHLHPGLGGRRARRRIAAPAFDLHQAQPARAERLERIGRAQLRHVDAGFDRGAHHRRAGRHRDRLTVDFERDVGVGMALRRAIVGFVERIARARCGALARALARAAAALADVLSVEGHAGPSGSGRSLDRTRRGRLAGGEPKSSGKWSSADSTGYGVIPPIAHSEPASIVSQRSRSSVICRSDVSPLRIRAIVSTPRVEPIRHGVHLPHDSIAQNSIAYSASSARFDVSSCTTMPP
jgi:hypothetical protein